MRANRRPLTRRSRMTAARIANAKHAFREPVQAIRPTLPFARKYFSFVLSENMVQSRRPVSHEGRFAVVTDVEAGCGGRVDVAAWLVHADEQRRCARSSRVVLTPRRWCQVGG